MPVQFRFSKHRKNPTHLLHRFALLQDAGGGFERGRLLIVKLGTIYSIVVHASVQHHTRQLDYLLELSSGAMLSSVSNTGASARVAWAEAC